MGLLARIFGFWRRPQPEANPFPKGDERHELWEALQALGKRKRTGYQPDRSFRPLELDENITLGKALAGLGKPKRLPGESETQRFELKVKARDAAAELAKAARAVHERNRKLGIKEREHYYGVGERLQTGEVDRTYQVKGEAELPELDPDKVPKHDEEKEEPVWEVE